VAWIDEGATTAVAEGKSAAGAWAWGLCWLMFASTVLNYMDRQAVAVVGEKITGEFRIGFEEFGWVVAAFQISYAFCQVPAGYLADRWDVRWTYAGAVAWWSLAAIAVAVAPTLGLLMVARGVLGVGEAFNWPCALRVTADVLPPADRGLGNGIFNSGAAVGAVLTPLVVAPLTVWLGWRAAFAAIGAAGFVWVATWLVVTRGRDALGSAARRTIGDAEEGRGPSAPAWWAFGGLAAAGAAIGWFGWPTLGRSALWLAVAWLMVGSLLVALAMPMRWLGRGGPAAGLGAVVRHRRFWVLVVVSVTVNVCWHFLVNWVPTYLKTDRGLEFVAGSLLSALPFLAADGGNLGGGALSRWLARAGGRSPAGARLVVVAGCSLLIAAGALIGKVQGVAATIAVLSVMALGAAAFMANYFAYCQEVAPAHTGLVVGILGGLGNLFAAGFSPIAGQVKDTTGGFAPVFVVVGLLPFLGVAALAIGWGKAAQGRID